MPDPLMIAILQIKKVTEVEELAAGHRAEKEVAQKLSELGQAQPAWHCSWGLLSWKGAPAPGF